VKVVTPRISIHLYLCDYHFGAFYYDTKGTLNGATWAPVEFQPPQRPICDRTDCTDPARYILHVTLDYQKLLETERHG
jgi:hypothetical protein